jgi:hypothetical protein
MKRVKDITLTAIARRDETSQGYDPDNIPRGDETSQNTTLTTIPGGDETSRGK